MENDTQRAPRSLYSHQNDYHRPDARPLSDIRELTEPNLFDPIQQLPTGGNTTSQKPQRNNSHRSVRTHIPSSQPWPRPPISSKPRGSATTTTRRSEDAVSTYSIPLGNIPPRSSSRGHGKRSLSARRECDTIVSREPAVLLPQPRGPFQCVANTGHAESPIKDGSSRKLSIDPQRSARIPSKTIVKIEHPSSEHLLQEPHLPHPRLKVDLLLAAPLFVGGSSVEGVLRIVVDDAERLRHRKLLTLERVSIDLLGVEEITQPKERRKIFLTRGNELVDICHPPPPDMVDSQHPLEPTKRSWILVPSVSTLPFLLTLPLTVGPPPFVCKFARIRYVVCATLVVKDAGRQLSVRCTQETALLSVQDPERALVSLPSPLTAAERAVISHRRHESIVVTAGLHRQVWVSGTNLFTDVHIVNDSHKTVRKLELRLERIVLCYNHAAAATLETSASGARMFDQKERITVAKTTIRPGYQGWSGVLPYTTVLRTCGLEVPRDHATIPCHTLFEVRYYLYIAAFTTHSKVATVQLPIHIIHMNSLDVPTNSVAQVAAAIEERRQGRATSRNAGRRGLSNKVSNTSFQGVAFNAPRTESLNRAKARLDEGTPRENQAYSTPRNDSALRGAPRLRRMSSTFSFKTPSSKRKGRVFGASDADELSRQLRHMRKNSFGSTATNRSVPRGRQPTRKSSALGFYLQEMDVHRTPRAPRAASTYAASHISSQRLSGENRRPPSLAAKSRLPQMSHGKGKGRAFD